MISITRGTTNTIVLTLTEKASITNPVFLFELVDDQSRQAYHFIAADQSQYPDRYNEFNISEQVSPDTLSGQVSLPSPGDYHYTIYQQSSTTNLDPAQADGILETGKAVVIEISAPDRHVYNSQNDQNIIYGSD
jgi:hypothetical protein